MVIMKNWNDIMIRFRNEMNQWFIKQNRDLHTKHYIWFLESTSEHDGGIIISSDKPINSEYQLASPGHIRRDLTVDQNISRSIDILRKLPILINPYRRRDK